MTEQLTAAPVPFKRLAWKPPEISVEYRADGAILLASRHLAGPAPRSILHLLAERAEAHPGRAFLRQRQGGGGPWRTITYGEALRAAEGIAQYLIDLGLEAGACAMVLSGNSLEHGLFMLGCAAASVVVVPVSPAFSLTDSGRERLQHCARLVRPQIVFAQSGEVFSAAMQVLQDNAVRYFVTVDRRPDAIDFADMMAPAPGPEVAWRRDAIGPETLFKILFTSGSTGMPKAVPQTHGMMAAVIAGLMGLRDEQAEDWDSAAVSETLEWMPWSHIAAGNINFNIVLNDGGTLYLDEGKPVRGQFEATIANLREISPIHFSSAPIAFAMLADELERDAGLRASFFRKLRYLAYGGATMSNDVYDRLQALAIAETGYRIPVTTMYGATETQGIAMTHWVTERAGLVGLPLPGLTIKLVPNGAKLEIRVRGATVTRGYLGDPGLSAAAFDEEGFFKLGDAVRFVNPIDPALGLVFDGRVAEDFKLSSGTWVSVGVLRPDIVAACSPYVEDAVIAGQDRAYAGALLWPSAAARSRFTAGDDFDPEKLSMVLRTRLVSHNAAAQGSSRRIERFAIITEPLCPAAGEITDKGYVNQRAVLERRTEIVEALFRTPAPPGVVCVATAPV